MRECAHGALYLVLGVLLDLQKELDVVGAVVLREVHHLVDGDHLLPILLQVVPAGNRDDIVRKVGIRFTGKTKEQVVKFGQSDSVFQIANEVSRCIVMPNTVLISEAYRLWSINSGAILFITNVCADGSSIPSICQPRAFFMALCKASNSE